MNSVEIIKKLKSMANPKNLEGMTKFKIGGKNTLGISIPELRSLAKQIGKNHELALQLWRSGIHEAKILASMIDEADKVTEKQIDSWTKDFDSWDVCDQTCMNLFARTKFANKKAIEYSKRKEEFVKRTAFALMACLAWQEKNADRDKELVKFFPIIKRESTDERNFVRKAVNWALRQIGKTNKNLRKEAIETADEILKINSKSARWIAGDALRELKKK